MKIKYPIIVEGKYDKIKLDSIVEATVISTGGFGIFNSNETLSLIRQLANKDKIILLTDSDGGGHLIRSYIKTAIPQDRIINVYIPRIEGKEKRKRSPSKEGILGVEGLEKEELLKVLEPFSDTSTREIVGTLTKAEMYRLGLSGGENSAKKREAVLKALNLPHTMTPNAMLSALNILYSKDELIDIINRTTC